MNVYEATQERLKTVFEEFDNVYVSFSGGKDSGVLLNLCLDFIKKNYPNRKLGVFHIDYEAQYQMTTEYVERTFKENAGIIDLYNCCMPLSVSCCTSMFQDRWTPWDKDKKDIWARPMPKESINEDNHEFDNFYKGMWDYDFQEMFANWVHKKTGAKKTCCLVGIRTQESLHRWRAIHSDKNKNKYKKIPWTKKMFDGVYNAYPIYDWMTKDIWISNSKNKHPYNKLYDIYYQAGLNIDQMRVASPFISQGINTLKMYRIIEPNTWGKLIGRVNGVNFSGIYGGTTAMGWKSITLPAGYTWKKYMEFLLSTLPREVSENYKKKLEVSKKFWKKKGGCLSLDVIKKLTQNGVDIEVCQDTNYKTDKKPVRMEYIDDIDIAEFNQIPTYKRMCVCIMKNDHLCKFMGFSLTKKETEIRKNAETKYSKIKERK